MGKLDYLLKYTKKPKKSKKEASQSNVIALDDSIKPVSNVLDDSNVVIEKVKETKGFKRIDNGEVKAEVKTTPTAKPGVQQETIYRDLTGKVVDISKIQKKPKNQILLNETKEETTTKSFTINKSDKEYNEMLKNKRSHEDPFKSKVRSERLSYNKGVNIPNRFNIKAGVLWDGIDRSNGFEKLLMRKRNDMKVNSKKEVDEYEMDFEL